MSRLKPTPMVRLLAVILERDVDSVTQTLLAAGVIEFVDVRELAGNANIAGIAKVETSADLSGVRSRVGSLLSARDISAESESHLDAAQSESLDIEAVTKRIERVASTVQRERNVETAAQRELEQLSDLKQRLGLFESLGTGIRTSNSSFLRIHTGSVETSRLQSLRESVDRLPVVLIEASEKSNSTHLILIGLKREESEVESILDQYGWSDSPISDVDRDSERIGTGVDDRIAKATQQRDEARQAARGAIAENRVELLGLWGAAQDR